MASNANPAGLDGFAFVEFTSPEPDRLAWLFGAFGFILRGRHKKLQVDHYRQGGINLLLNREPSGHAAGFRSRACTRSTTSPTM
jgi:4-hydroxyphenylpyruvate dioxygenase